MKNGIAVVALCTLLQAGLYAQDPKPSPTEPGDVVKISDVNYGSSLAGAGRV